MVMEVHPPHERIHGWRDFFLHLTIITVGLLIALGLEGCVEWVHHKHLVHQAETKLRQEIDTNQKDLQGTLAALPHTEKQVQDALDLLRKIRDKQKPEARTLSFEFAEPTLKEAAWQTARDTGALSYMPYDHVERYADLYATQRLVESIDAALIEAISRGVAGVMIESDPLKMTPQEAEVALADAGEIKARLYILKNVAHQLNERYTELLNEQRDK